MTMKKDAAHEILMEDLFGATHPRFLKIYIRGGYRRPKGVVVAHRIGDTVYYGWSICAKNFDVFDKEIGTAIALKRAIGSALPDYKFNGYPVSVLKTVEILRERAVRYFKGCTC